MTRFAPKWLQASQYAASEDRHLIGALWPAPASSGCKVTAAGAMSVEIAPGSVAVPVTGGTVLCVSDAVETVTLDAAPAAGSDRVDYVICQARGTDIDGGADNDFIFAKATGPETPGGSGYTKPALPANAVKLAEIVVHGGDATINPAFLYDWRPFGLAVGQPVEPVAPGGAIASFIDAGGEAWVAKEGVNEGAWKRARDVLHSWVYRSAPFSIPAGASPLLGMDTVRNDDYGLYSTIGGAYVLPVGGWWHIECHLAGGAAAGNWIQSLIVSSINGVMCYGMCHTSSGVWNMATASLSARFVAGDVVSFQMSCSNGQPGNPGQQATYGTADYMGSN